MVQAGCMKRFNIFKFALISETATDSAKQNKFVDNIYIYLLHDRGR